MDCVADEELRPRSHYKQDMKWQFNHFLVNEYAVLLYICILVQRGPTTNPVSLKCLRGWHD